MSDRSQIVKEVHKYGNLLDDFARGKKKLTEADLAVLNARNNGLWDRIDTETTEEKVLRETIGCILDIWERYDSDEWDWDWESQVNDALALEL